MNSMDIERAISHRQAKINQLQKYVEELREAERELGILLEARRIVGLDSGEPHIGYVEPIQRPKRRYARAGRPKTPQSLAADTMRVLEQTEQQDMSHREIHRELEKTRGPTSKRALWGTLSRLVHERRIQRPRAARYAAIRPGKNVTVGVPEDGMNSGHHAEEATQTNNRGEASLSLQEAFAE